MQLTANQLQQIQKYFSTQTDVRIVYLYGSIVDNRTHKQSDLDFGMLFDPVPKNHYRLGEVTLGLAKLNLPTGNLDVREINLEQSPLYLKHVIQGKIVYSRDESRRISFETKVMEVFFDTQRLRDLKTYYMDKRLEKGTYGY